MIYFITILLLTCSHSVMHSSAAYSQGFAKALALLHAPQAVISDHTKKQKPEFPLTAPANHAAQSEAHQVHAAAATTAHAKTHAQLAAMTKVDASSGAAAQAAGNSLPAQTARTSASVSNKQVCNTRETKVRLELEYFRTESLKESEFLFYYNGRSILPECLCAQPKFGVPNNGPCPTQQERINSLNNYFRRLNRGQFCCILAADRLGYNTYLDRDLYAHYKPYNAAWPTDTNEDIFNAQLLTFQLKFAEAQKLYKKYWSENLKNPCALAVNELEESPACTYKGQIVTCWNDIPCGDRCKIQYRPVNPYHTDFSAHEIALITKQPDHGIYLRNRGVLHFLASLQKSISR